MAQFINELSLNQPYKIKYFWGYNNYELPFKVKKYKGSTGYKKSGRIRITLNILIEDLKGQKILIYQNLLPWSETPNNWEYKTIEEKGIRKIKIRQVRKFLNALVKYSDVQNEL